MIKRVFYGAKNGLYNYSKFVVDAAADIANLPTTSAHGSADGETYSPCCAGSIAAVVDERKVYMLNNVDEWKLWGDMTAGGGGGGGGSDWFVTDDGEGNVTIL